MEELIRALTTQLGVTEQQARGGTGALFKAAQERLGATEFNRMLGGLAGVDRVLKSAPSASASGGLLGGLASMAAKVGGSSDMAQAAKVLAAVSSLGLTKETILQFVPIILKYVETHGGPELVAQLRAALKV
jgi:hypothetical protein